MKWIHEVVDGDRHGDHYLFHGENEKMQLEKTMQLAEKNRKKENKAENIPVLSGRLVEKPSLIHHFPRNFLSELFAPQAPSMVLENFPMSFEIGS